MIKLSDLMFEGDSSGSFVIEENEELLQAANRIRSRKGYPDIPSKDNEIYYNFYVTFDWEAKTLQRFFVVHNSEADDFGTYDLPIEDVSQNVMLLWKILEDFCNTLKQE